MHCGNPSDADPVDPRHADPIGSSCRERVITNRRPPRHPIRVGIVDDHPTVVAAIATAIRDAADLRLIGTARTTDEATELASKVDVLVCDMNLAGGAEGLQVLRSVHDPRTLRERAPAAVLFLSGFGYPSLIRAALDGGAAGYLDKAADVPEIIDAIRTIASGGTAYSAAALLGSREARRRPSEREIQVIGRVVNGATNAEIAAALDLSEKTVESHLRRLFDRYGLLSRTELAVLSMEEGWTADRRAGR
ncbi:MAG TPA: response regulator transcription factor [Candidatus Limnocylindrales bacterium]|nr:response regulator transcription factor [Candidatus Limnocylindrales bacterium]